MTQNDLIPYFTVQQSVEVGFDTSVALPRPSRAASSRLARVTGQKHRKRKADVGVSRREHVVVENDPAVGLY